MSGVGDDAFYEVFQSHESPMFVVRKGDAAFQVRVLNGLELRAFSLDEEKAKEAQLGKMAAGQL
jgi:hypothetical protein